MQHSEQQLAIFEHFKSGKGHLVVRARAGTGKTTTICEGINQVAPGLRALLCAFGNEIAKELTARISRPNTDCKTLHSLGFSIIRNNWRNVRIDKDNPRGERLAREACGHTASDEMVDCVAKLVSFAKGCMPFANVSDLVQLAEERGTLPEIDNLNKDESWEKDVVWEIAGAARKAMDLALEKDGTIDFDDMVYVPVANGWLRGTYDVVVVDEAQDMNASQLMLARGVCKKNGRIIVVGDDRQAIFGFRGADSGSIDRLKFELEAKELGLTVTYRCPRSVVELASKLVPDYTSAPGAPEGEISRASFETMVSNAQVGDFVLSRKNAPLAGVCLALLRAGKRAKIKGRDIGKGLVALVRRVKGKSMPDFLSRLAAWETREIDRAKAAKRGNVENRIAFLQDQAETLRGLAEGLSGVKELETRIFELFADVEGGDNRFIVCSSIHRAKGLETDRVYVLEHTLLRNGDQEERNLEYVAITRAKRELVFTAKQAA